MSTDGHDISQQFRILSAQSDRIQHDISPLKILRHFWSQRRLTWQFAIRGIKEEYQGSYLGLSWTFLSPLLQTLVYTFVFGFIFRARFEGSRSGSPIEYAIGLLAGLAAFEVFRHSLGSAPNLVFRNSNLVTKVVFPLEILSIGQLGPAITQSLARALILVVAAGIVQQKIHWTIIMLPLVYFPLLLFSLGVNWFIASVGVFFRDIRHLITVVLRLLMFATPIFYSLSSVPEPFRSIISINPLAIFVNHFRRLMLWGELPDWGALLNVTIVSFLTCWLGYVWFMRTRRLFADVM